MKPYQMICYLILAWSTCVTTLGLEPKVSKRQAEWKREREKIETYLQKFLDLRDYEQMESCIEEWKKLPLDDRAGLYDLLIEYLYEKKDTPVAQPGNMRVESRLEGIPKEQKIEIIKQDVYIKGGRCAWALERLLQMVLPTISAKSSTEEIDKVPILAYNHQNRLLLKESLALLDTMSVEEKRKLATHKRIYLEVLDKLAQDKDVEVRRNVAKNKMALEKTLERLAKEDPNAEVRESAKKTQASGPLTGLSEDDE